MRNTRPQNSITQSRRVQPPLSGKVAFARILVWLWCFRPGTGSIWLLCWFGVIFHWSVHERLWREEQRWRCQLFGWETRPQTERLLVFYTTLLPKTVGAGDRLHQPACLLSFGWHLSWKVTSCTHLLRLFNWQCIIICKVIIPSAKACEFVRESGLYENEAFQHFILPQEARPSVYPDYLLESFLFFGSFSDKRIWGCNALASTAKKKCTLSDLLETAVGAGSCKHLLLKLCLLPPLPTLTRFLCQKNVFFAQ